MTNQERWTLYENGEFRQDIAIELLDWAGYWTTAGLDPIEDTLQKAQTRRAIQMILEDISYVLKIVDGLVISDDAIKAASPEDVTPEFIHPIIVSIMANKLAWITGISEIQAV